MHPKSSPGFIEPAARVGEALGVGAPIGTPSESSPIISGPSSSRHSSNRIPENEGVLLKRIYKLTSQRSGGGLIISSPTSVVTQSDVIFLLEEKKI